MLSQRAYNCLKRANLNTVGDILDLLEEDENGLRRIRNLGSKSEEEIKALLEEVKREYANQVQQTPGTNRRLVRPSRKTMSSRIEEFHLSGRSLRDLHSAGVFFVQDLYSEDILQEPGWFAVRELFERILMK